MLKSVIGWLLILLSWQLQAQVLDTIVAVVEDDVILERELQDEVLAVVQRIQASKSEIPPNYVLRKQVLEKMIVDKLQRQLAEKAGINVSEEMLNSSVADIAQRNNMSVEQFREELARQGMDYAAFLNNMRNEIVINQLRGREIGGRIKVTDREVDHYLETQDKIGDASIQYHLGHILVAVKEGASASEIQKALAKAGDIVNKLRAGADFTQMAMTQSDDANALKGGDLGWRTMSEMPTLFVTDASNMTTGDIGGPIRSPSGFHIIKMLETKGVGQHTIVKTKVRHILIKTNELIDDAEAKKRLLALKQRITDGDDFAGLARTHSDDKGSALKGGSLDWVGPNDLVKPFEEAMSKLAINEISEPVQTQFGWHLIQVLDRENKDDSSDYRKNQVRDAIRKRKIEEETELWLRKLRDEAYVEIYEDRL
ncbi:MAG: peptidylprolyl isomerase [Methylococcaceae bacterium]|nr:peptidylprolyl isomerase [Methylococcaceae bacterium]MDZ4155594.1 peptidylprolyl isomerase [Methylococcales bacterium]MDP2395317.1 peptidylprolyl isomerase [Methylococcaceae bacterium]MDP3020571.1 peptidylprolyl isomerase [Methylococcaceae bacterium]MDP3390010.1 peptidylprolyl isomerase [Methylococcaceae bacterium]